MNAGADATHDARTVHVILPGDVDDAAAPSGGNVYDRRVCHELSATHDWFVHQVAVPGSWPRPDATARDSLARALAAPPDGAVVLVDGLVACGVPEIVVPHAGRLRLAILVHLPLADETGLASADAADLDSRERATLRAASAVVVTSTWAAQRLARHGIDASQVHVAEPGTDPAPLAPGTDGASRLVCVAAVTPRKGHDLLVEALAAVADLRWSCMWAGALDRDPAHVARLRQRINQRGLADRVRLAGPLTGESLDSAHASADLAVLPSRAETYGMVLTEALARGIPVLATSVDAVPETVGRAADGSVPGLLVPPEDAEALAAALRRWLGQPDLRQRLKIAARSRRGMLEGWERTSRSLASVLEQLRRQPPNGQPLNGQPLKGQRQDRQRPDRERQGGAR